MTSEDTLEVAVQDLAGVNGPRPVTGGVPLAEGTAPAGCAFQLRDASGQPVALQAQPLAVWKDRSVRWLLLDFIADLTAGSAAEFSLVATTEAPSAAELSPPVSEKARPSTGFSSAATEDEGESAGTASTATGSQMAGQHPGEPAVTLPGEGVALGTMSLAPTARGGLLDLAGQLTADLVLIDGDGVSCSAVTESVEVECAGPVRATLALRGAFRDAAGERRFQFRLRASIYAKLQRVRLEPLILIDADTGIIQNVRSLDLILRPAGDWQSVRFGGAPQWQGQFSDTPARLFQRDDEKYEIQGHQGSKIQGGRAPGWAELASDGRVTAVALRDFWQQWPKSLELRTDGLALGLFPAFEEGDFSHMEPWYKHQYLFEGSCYRLRTGQARKWDIWIDLDGDGDQLSRLADAPAIPAADPTQAVATGVWDAITPAGIPEMAEYDPWAENLYGAYCESIRTQRDYGSMNWGDWFGERQVNWGNHEYDTVDQLLIQFARTGDPRYFLTADAAARHSTEVDVIHHVNGDLAAEFTSSWPGKDYPPRPGMVHEHCVGHVGSFYPTETIRQLFVEHSVGSSPNPYLCLDPFNLGHIWTQGMVRHYFLTGDPFVRETVACIGDNLARLVEDGVHTFGIDDPHFGRAAGWPLLAMSGAYELDHDERFLAAMRDIVDRALERQDPVCGGWLYELYPGHCFCTTHKHVGKAGFIASILVNALSRYYLLTGDERIPDAVDRAVTFVDQDTWIDQRSGWRYTSCPASSFSGQPGVTVTAHVNAVRLSDTPEHLRVLRRAWDAKFTALQKAPSSAGQGKTYTATVYGCAEAVGLLARHP